MNIPFCMGVGGSFDVVAGKFKRHQTEFRNRLRMGLSVETRTTPNVQKKCRRYAKVCGDGLASKVLGFEVPQPAPEQRLLYAKVTFPNRSG